MTYQPEAAAAALHEARQRRGQVAPLSADIAPRTEVEGAAVQRALAYRTGAASPGGFKIGATARRVHGDRQHPPQR
jgi:2-keto-4-pentenoate hydratase